MTQWFDVEYDEQGNEIKKNPFDDILSSVITNYQINLKTGKTTLRIIPTGGGGLIDLKTEE